MYKKKKKYETFKFDGAAVFPKKVERNQIQIVFWRAKVLIRTHLS